MKVAERVALQREIARILRLMKSIPMALLSLRSSNTFLTSSTIKVRLDVGTMTGKYSTKQWQAKYKI